MFASASGRFALVAGWTTASFLTGAAAGLAVASSVNGLLLSVATAACAVAWGAMLGYTVAERRGLTESRAVVVALMPPPLPAQPRGPEEPPHDERGGDGWMPEPDWRGDGPGHGGPP